jgi:hypothetical protein
VWLTQTVDRMVAIGGLLDPEAGQTLLAAVAPLARPADAHDPRSGSQRKADALEELARRQLKAGQLPRTGGVRPQLSVLVDLQSLTGQPGALGGDSGGAGPLSPAACQRLACDATVTRVLVCRQPTDADTPSGGCGDHNDPSGSGLAGRLRAAMTRLPPLLGGAPPCPWMSAARPGWSARPNATPWPSATAVCLSRAVAARSAGAKPIMCGTG